MSFIYHMKPVPFEGDSLIPLNQMDKESDLYKGHARKLAEIDELGYPENFSGIQDFPELTNNMEQRGWHESRIRKVMGENWVSFLKKVWGN